MKRIFALILGVSALAAQSTGYEPELTAAKELVLPPNYREWVYLSSGLGMTYGPAAATEPRNPSFDNVFVNPSSYRAFLETGRWPDKTLFVLEVRRSVAKGSINNGGHYQGELASVEAELKDRRLPGGWAYFGYGRGKQAQAAPATSSCNACHGSNAAVENTFVQFYPTLLEVATRKNTLNASYTPAAPEAH